MTNQNIDVLWDDNPVDITSEANFIWSIANKLIPVYVCYIMVAVYMLGSVILLICGRKNMGHNKRITITTCIVAALAVTVYQMIHPQALLTSLVSVFVIIGFILIWKILCFRSCVRIIKRW